MNSKKTLDHAGAARRPNDGGARASAEPSDNEVNRRELLKLGAATVVATSIAGLESTAALARPVVQAQNTARLFFTAEEFALVDELTELIIPADDHSPGARAAACAAYIDFRLSESEEQDKTQWREGLQTIEKLSQEMSGKRFLESTADQRIALLTRIAQNEMKPEKPEEKFFRELKRRTVRAYYTSEIGLKQELEYKGNTYLKEFVGHDAT
jgi:hypothetical protein